MPVQPESASFVEQRQRMVSDQLRARGVRDERILSAMGRVPRTTFVPDNLKAQSYCDHPIPLPKGQTISQPFIVAAMLEALVPEPSQTVLEIGTGSGYQTALLAELFAQVYSVERHSELAVSADQTLRSLGYQNIHIVTADGTRGLPSFAPYDAILVSAATQRIPPALFDQLRDGGRMIIPVGPSEAQQLQLVKKENEQMLVKGLENCRFVPLVSDAEANFA
jgi:protein-L-isoaspartate(D-aspartate) O-methyltransferase